jgi:hypothetical protein
MAAGRRLTRRIDWDLVERIEAGGSRPPKRTKPKIESEARKASTYRCARRNRDRINAWPLQSAFRQRRQLEPISIPLNRSRDLPFAPTYQRAREISARKRAMGAIQ